MKSKLNHEKLMQLLRANIQTVLNSYDEPAAIAVSVTWQPELGDELPVGMLLVKEDATAELLHRCLRQNTKMGEQIVANLRREIEQSAPSVRSASKESDNGKESTGPTDSGPFAPGTK